MADGETPAQPKPKKIDPGPKPQIDDPRDDMRARLMKHRNRLRSFSTSRMAGLARKIVDKN